MVHIDDAERFYFLVRELQDTNNRLSLLSKNREKIRFNIQAHSENNQLFSARDLKDPDLTVHVAMALENQIREIEKQIEDLGGAL